MNIGVIHSQEFGSQGTGSAHSGTLLCVKLAERGHDIEVYCPTNDGETEPFIHEQLSNIQIIPLGGDSANIPIPKKRFASIGRQLPEHTQRFEQVDVLHSYVAAIPWLNDIREKISTPIVTTLTGYGPLCPKRDLFYMDESPCRENGVRKCSKCVLKSGVYPESSELFGGASYYDTYDGAERIPVTGYQLLRYFQSLRTISDIKKTNEQIDAYHVLSDHMVDIFGDFGFPNSKMKTIPNILDTEFRRPHKSDFSEPYNLLYVGSLQRKKGVQKLIPIVEFLNNQYDNEYSLTIIGDGTVRPRLESQAADADSPVEFTGRVDYRELPDHYSSHDLFVYPGIWEEPFGRVFLEAMATGTPIISSDVGSVESIVGDAGVVTDGSVENLSRAINTAINEGRLNELSTAGKQRVERYDPSNVMPQFESIYESIL